MAKKAADQFDEQHEMISLEAERLLGKLLVDSTSLASARRLDMALFAMRSNRYPVQPLRLGALISPRYEPKRKYHLRSMADRSDIDGPPGGPWMLTRRVVEQEVVGQEGRQRKQRAWKLEESIWKPRRKWADSRDFIDTPDCMKKALQADWRMVRAEGSLDRFMRKHHKADGDVVDLVFEVLWEQHEFIYCIFDNFAMQGGGDFTHIQLNSYKDLLQMCGLVEEGSEGLNGSRWDELFVAINATSDEADQFNHKKGLNRQEFLDFIVRAAVMRHCHLAVAEDVPKAVQTLITVDMLPRIKIFDPLALEPANAFRRSSCYTEETSECLKKHAASLRLVYEGYAYGDGAIGSKFEDKRLLGIEEYRDLMLDLGFIDSQFAERDATWCFVMSRMRTVSEAELKGRIKLLQLQFEDFLEALVRIASLKALPTDEEVRREGCVDAGHLILSFEALPPQRLIDFLESHDVPRGQPLQPIHRAVEQLVTLICRTISTTLGRPLHAEPKITSGDVRRFLESHGKRES